MHAYYASDVRAWGGDAYKCDIELWYESPGTLKYGLQTICEGWCYQLLHDLDEFYQLDQFQGIECP